MRFKIRLMVAGLCLALPSLAGAATIARSKVTVTGKVTSHGSARVPECGFEQGHENGWIFSSGVPLPKASLSVWAENSNLNNPSAHNAKLATSKHFNVQLQVFNPTTGVPRTWAAGHVFQTPKTPYNQGSGTFSVSKVRMSGLPYGAKYALVGSIKATLPGETTYFGDLNGHLHANVTAGRVKVSASFTCWWPGNGATRGGK